jgi:hypothetical protein
MHQPILLSVFASLWLCLSLVMGGCAGDPCKNADCGDFGNCSEVSDEAVCFCVTGYEQDDEDRCTVKSTAKFLGRWRVDETNTANRAGLVETITCSYEVEIIESDADVRRVILSNFPNISCLDTSPISCNLQVEGSASIARLTLRGAPNGITYCDDQGAAVNFSGFQVSNSNGGEAITAISADGRSMTFAYRLAYQLDANQDGRQENYLFDCNATFTKI